MSEQDQSPDTVTYPAELGFDFSDKPIPFPSWMPIFTREYEHRLNQIRAWTLGWDRMMDAAQAAEFLNRMGFTTGTGQKISERTVKKWSRKRALPLWAACGKKKKYTSYVCLCAWLWSYRVYRKEKPYQCVGPQRNPHRRPA